MKTWILFLASLLALDANASKTIVDGSLNVDEVTQFDGTPWGIALLNDQEAIVTVKKGVAYKVNLANGKQQALSGLPEVDNRGQGGLLDVAKSPTFDEEKWVYFTYSKPTDEGAKTTLARAKLIDNGFTKWQDLLVSDSASSDSKHYGGRIAFDDKGHVFFSIGDRGVRENAQNLNNHAGSIIRLNLDGSVPADNPFVTHANIRNEIWSYGHRNPQGLFYDTDTHTLWSNEHGPRGGDEINLIRPGANYGWPIVSHGKEYWGPVSVGDGIEKDGIDNPIKVFIPSIAPSSLLRYKGMLFSNWNGDFLSTALALRHLNKVKIEQNGETTETRYLEDLDERLRSIAQDSTGALYIGTDSGKLLKITLAIETSLKKAG
ncbi:MULTISPECIES: PQQ-dependent sugar dehydrogenase [Marinomonas]|uniref:PQQ-dependent sugar dehydrogenase n=1 Tax=Marinomonas arctica TaxID=383750 RepID=A0A7H1J1I4_9GAMM|nr:MULTISPECIES: PQQ-dependent sugar dehydrogenase [Marinomonas]MCS7488024.1 dehydrogenase [Marinomonas sp. BSi20414]QNT04350.1 PQQ-dependent sugar dehydrogenase [Marinomonas arctica]GGN31414.1 dehydrogenase [Marinomonas arctica]